MYVSAEQAVLVRQQVEAGQKFRRQLEWPGSPASSGAMLSWKLPRPPRKRRPKKGLQNGVRSRGRRRDRSALRTGVVDEWDCEAIETAARCMAMRVAARVVEQRLNADTSDHAGPTLPCACGVGALRRPAWQELRERAGASEAGAGLLLLRALRRGLLSARPGAGFGGWVTLSGSAAHGWVGGRDGQLRGGPRVSARA